jgi:tRNA modification GTPase
VKVETIEAIRISARTREGIDALKQTMKSLSIGAETLSEGSIMLTNLRHYEAVRNALQSLLQAETQVQHHAPTELIASDLRDALHHIGTITGKVSTDDISESSSSRSFVSASKIGVKVISSYLHRIVEFHTK